MLRRVIYAIAIVPAAAALVGFAVANRQSIRLSFDPFAPASPSSAVTLPLYVVAFMSLFAGVVLGGIAAWLRQGRTRRARARLAADLAAARTECAALRGEVEAMRRAQPRRLPVPPPAA